MKNIKESILLQLIPLFLALTIFLFTQKELYVTTGIIILILISFKIKYYEGEWKVLLFGIITGLLFEIAGDAIYKLQYWEKASLMGIPLWLPLMWGYGFVFIRRVGNLLVKKEE